MWIIIDSKFSNLLKFRTQMLRYHYNVNVFMYHALLVNYML